VASDLIVAVTATIKDEQDVRRLRLNAAYTSALGNAGLIPLVVPPLTGESDAAEILERVDGLVLTGGEDIDPSWYGAPPHAKLGEVQKERDATEIAIVRAARERGLPTLAICRGIQLVNVAFGGTLVQDIPSERPNSLPHNPAGPRDRRTHSVDIIPDSALARAIGAEKIEVNSFHHQCPDRIAPGLRVTATAPDGIVEGLESDDAGWWMLAVQWHPEELDRTSEPWDRGLFSAFASASLRTR
jgi:putative glutamine amidotransferase